MASGIHVGNVIVGVLPDMTGFHEKIRAETLNGKTSSLGNEIGGVLSTGIGEKVAVGEAVEGSVAKDAAKITSAGESIGSKFTEALQGPFGAVSGMLTAALAVGGSAEIFKTLLEAGEKAEQAQKIVEQAIQATGGAAHVTAEQISALADSQSRKAGVDKASILQADALLLRYKGVDNEVGKGNDIFNRASQAALDLTAAMNKGQVTSGGLAATSKALGKALEDPAKGMTALRRFGVVLDAQQQAMIKTDMKHNNTLAAQKVILDAVNGSYGGTAARMATNSAKMKASLDDLEATLGQALLPAFNALLGAITGALTAMMPLAEWFLKGGTAATILRDALIALTLSVAAYVIYTKAAAFFTELWKTATEEQTIAQRLLDAAMDANVIGLVIAAIVALVFILIEVYQHSKAFRDMVADITAHLKLWTAEVMNDVRPMLTDITNFFESHTALWREIWTITWTVIKTIVEITFADMIAFFKTSFDIIVAVFKVFTDLLTGNWSGAWNAIRNLVVQIWNNISQFLMTAFDDLNNATGGKLDIFKNIFNDTWNWLRQVFGADLYNFFVNTIPSWFGTAVSAVANVWSKIYDAIAGPVKKVGANVLTHLFNAIDDITNFVGIGKPLASAVSSLSGMATGGVITQGTTGTADDVLVRVSRGETVVSAAHSRLPYMMAAFGAAGVPGYTTGAIGFPPHVPGYGNAGMDWIKNPKARGVPGFAAGGTISGGALEDNMLKFMMSKQGDPYSEANRWGAPPYDCSSLVWSAAHAAGIPIPQSAAIANTEAAWFAGWDSDYMYTNASQIQQGDILFMSGASPDPSQWGGIGHTGMALSSNSMISALGTAYGVTQSGISGFTVGARLGGPGGKGILSDIGHILSIFGGAVKRTFEDIFHGLGTLGSIAVDLAKGNVGGAISALLSKWKGTGGALGGLAKMLTALPPKLVGEIIHKIAAAVKNFAASQQSTGGGSANIAYKVGAGVTQWTSDVDQALKMLGLSLSLDKQVLYQMQTESGGNPNAVNNWDINAQHGDPSKGLLQVIGATFAQYHVPGTSNNIFDPLANIAAAINYARARYGPTLISGGMGMGSGHGYDIGGWLPPGASWAFNGTGRPEPVLSTGQWDAIYKAATGSDGASHYHAHFDGLTGAAIESHVRSAFTAMSIQDGNMHRQGRRR